MNVYSDNLYTAMDFLSCRALNISNLLYIGKNLNVKNTKYDPSIFFIQQLIIQYSITVHNRLSTMYSLQFSPQRIEILFIGRETLLVTIEIKKKSR